MITQVGAQGHPSLYAMRKADTSKKLNSPIADFNNDGLFNFFDEEG